MLLSLFARFAAMREAHVLSSQRIFAKLLAQTLGYKQARMNDDNGSLSSTCFHDVSIFFDFFDLFKKDVDVIDLFLQNRLGLQIRRRRQQRQIIERSVAVKRHHASILSHFS